MRYDMREMLERCEGGTTAVSTRPKGPNLVDF